MRTKSKNSDAPSKQRFTPDPTGLMRVVFFNPTVIGTSMNTLPAVSSVSSVSSVNSKITVFYFGNMPITSMVIDGQIWLVAKEACNALEYDQSAAAVRQHVSENHQKLISTGDENFDIYRLYISKNTNIDYTKIRRILLINEPGIYELIIGSKQQKAKEFKRWLVEIVLPTINRTGLYIEPNIQEQQKAFSYTQEQINQIAKNAATEVQLLANTKGVTAGRHTRVGFVRPQYALDTAIEFIRLNCIFDLELIEETITEQDIYNEIILYVRDNLPLHFSDVPDHEILDYAYVYRLVRLRKYALGLIGNIRKEKTKDPKSVFLNYMAPNTYLH